MLAAGKSGRISAAMVSTSAERADGCALTTTTIPPCRYQQRERTATAPVHFLTRTRPRRHAHGLWMQRRESLGLPLCGSRGPSDARRRLRTNISPSIESTICSSFMSRIPRTAGPSATADTNASHACARETPRTTALRPKGRARCRARSEPVSAGGPTPRRPVPDLSCWPFRPCVAALHRRCVRHRPALPSRAVRCGRPADGRGRRRVPRPRLSGRGVHRHGAARRAAEGKPREPGTNECQTKRHA